MPETPLQLFKYVPPARVDILEKQRIAFSQPLSFNDPFDLHPVISHVVDPRFIAAQADELKAELVEQAAPHDRARLREFFREHRAGLINHLQQNAEPIAANLQAGLVKELNECFGVLCLAAAKSNLLMWAHYAASHRGIVIEFATNHPDFQCLGECLAVDYLEARPVYDPAQKASKKLYTTKSPDWSYENEFRIFRPFANCEQIESDGRRVFVHRLSKTAVTAVYLGVNSGEETLKRVKAAVAGTHIRIFKARLPRTCFGLEFTSVD